ncbi:hypothetical protein AX16_010169 [Volvariella volvacea WC 439]|nr:hypothetical protein AX16_010169 [Volvariella volvacea WC 439]
MQPLQPAPVKTYHILLSYPYSPRGYLTMFRSSTYESKLVDLIRTPESNVLIIYGDADEFTSASHYRLWTEGLRHALATEEREGMKVDIIEIAKGTHFWRGAAGEELGGMIWRWLP